MQAHPDSTGPAPLGVCRLGRIAFDQAWSLQNALRAKRQAQKIPDLLLLAEHPPTYTLGRSTPAADLPGGEAALRRRGAEVFRIERGGSVTYHGPGQLVGYPILDLRRRGRDVHRYLRQLEAVLIDTLACWGLEARRREGLTGVWVGDRKLAAIGVYLRGWVTMHGFALNIHPDLGYFAAMRPCGLDPGRVGSVEALKPPAPTLEKAADAVVASFGRVFGYAPRTMAAEAIAASPADL